MARRKPCAACPADMSFTQNVCKKGINVLGEYRDKPCDFRVAWKDDQGCTYFVRKGLGESNYKTFCRKPGSLRIKGFVRLPWLKSYEAAQSNLNTYAMTKGWKEVGMDV